MKFKYKEFSCDVDVFQNDKDVILRFYDKSKEQEEDEIVDLVIVDSGYGFLCLKYKGDSGLLSGYLDKTIFTCTEMVEEAVKILEDISGDFKNSYVPYHIDYVEKVDYTEYNGEY